jgi:hypothetical protein
MATSTYTKTEPKADQPRAPTSQLAQTRSVPSLTYRQENVKNLSGGRTQRSYARQGRS